MWWCLHNKHGFTSEVALVHFVIPANAGIPLAVGGEIPGRGPG